VLLGAGWISSRPLLDPFAGSGTIPIEAALMARRIPPGWRRTFAFETWPGFDDVLWRDVRARAESAILPRAPGPILGSDRDAGAIAMAGANSRRAGVSEDIEWSQAAFSRAARLEAPAWIVTNPPYGVRVGDAQKLRDLYAKVGQLAAAEYRDCTVALVAADPRLVRATGVRFREALAFKNGGIPVHLVVRPAGVSD
jgi:putative N6-adenine-specific DNA methylase